MSPIVLPRNERAAAKREGVSGARSSGLPGGTGAVPGRSARREWQEVGDTEAGSAEGPRLGAPRAPPRRRPPRPLGCKAPGGRGGQPEEGGRVPGGPTRGGGEAAGAKARRPGRALPPSAQDRAVPPPPRNAPLAQPRARRRGGGGAGGSSAGATCAPSRAGSPRASTCRGAGGRGVRGRLPLLLLLPPRRRCLFLPPAPSLIGPGGELRAPSSVRADLQEAGAPGGGSGGLPTVMWRRRRPGNCPFVRSARRRRAGRCSRCLSGSGVGGGEAWGGGAHRGGTVRGAPRYFVAETGAGVLRVPVAEPGGGGGRGGAGAAEPPKPSGRALEQRSPSGCAARVAPGLSRSAPPPRAPSLERAALQGPARWLGGRHAGYPGRAHSRPPQCPGRPGSPASEALGKLCAKLCSLGEGPATSSEGVWEFRAQNSPKPVGVGKRTTFLDISP